jgi:hypothetical protein
MVTITPQFTLETVILAPATIALGATGRAVWDLTAKREGVASIQLARQGATALTTGVFVLLNRLGAYRTPLFSPAMTTPGTACNGNTTVATATSNAGQNEITLTAVTNFAINDYICITDAAYTRCEWHHVAKLTISAGTGLTLACPLLFTHTAAQADTVRNKADSLCFTLPGGVIWEIILGHWNAAGESITARILGTSYNTDGVS